MSSASPGTAPDRWLLLADRLEDEVAARIGAALGEGRVEPLGEPRTALVMMTVTDPFDTHFHLGEVLVTEAVVALGEVRGWGMTTGDAPGRARLKAVLDALARAGDAALERAAGLLAPEEERLDAERRREEALVARTRVSFDLMPGNEAQT